MTGAEIIASVVGIGGLGGTILACTWHLSAKITTLVVTLQLHTASDEAQFRAVGGRINELFRWLSALAKTTLAQHDAPQWLTSLAATPPPTDGD